MTESEKFKLSNESDIWSKGADVFQQLLSRLKTLLPPSQIEHIGSTSIPGSLTKGDLDILIRVDANSIDEIDRILSQHYQRNFESDRNANFSSFYTDEHELPVGIQVAVIGSEYDNFLQFREKLCENPTMLEKYNQLKRSCEGCDMRFYREQKSKFIASVVSDSQTKGNHLERKC